MRAPLTVRSPASGSSTTAKQQSNAGALAATQAPQLRSHVAPPLQQHALQQPLQAAAAPGQPAHSTLPGHPARVVKELLLTRQKPDALGAGGGAHKLHAALRQPAHHGHGSSPNRDAALLPSLSSLGSFGPRNARYKPGVQPALLPEGPKAAQGAAGGTQPPGSLLPLLNKASLGRAAVGGKPAGSLEPRYGLGRRY